MAIVDHEVKSDGLPQIVVKDTVDALGELARYNIVRRRELDGDFDIIGLTGSVGKTTTKDLLSSLLATVGPTVAPVGSFNNEIGLPLTALRVDEHTRFFVAEMGASHIGEIARLTRIAPPNTAIVLKVGVAHLGEFGSRERIAQAKSEIVQGLLPGGTAVLTPMTNTWFPWPAWPTATCCGSAWDRRRSPRCGPLMSLPTGPIMLNSRWSMRTATIRRCIWAFLDVTM